MSEYVEFVLCVHKSAADVTEHNLYKTAYSFERREVDQRQAVPDQGRLKELWEQAEDSYSMRLGIKSRRGRAGSIFKSPSPEIVEEFARALLASPSPAAVGDAPYFGIKQAGEIMRDRKDGVPPAPTSAGVPDMECVCCVCANIADLNDIDACVKCGFESIERIPADVADLIRKLVAITRPASDAIPVAPIEPQRISELRDMLSAQSAECHRLAYALDYGGNEYCYDREMRIREQMLHTIYHEIYRTYYPDSTPRDQGAGNNAQNDQRFDDCDTCGMPIVHDRSKHIGQRCGCYSPPTPKQRQPQ